MNKGTVRERLECQYPDSELLLADGFDDAIIGVDAKSLRVIYSVDKCIEILQGDGMSEEEAQEYFDFKVVDAYVGEQTPIFLESIGEL